MNKYRVCAGAVASSLVLSACQTDGRRAFINQGIGPDLYTSDTRQEAIRLDAYLGSMCRQAGLQYHNAADGSFRCRDTNPMGRHWGIIALQGLNDVDRRCDAYLSWLDNKRRSRGPKLAQVAALRTATESIMGQASTGEKAITVVGSAFGLISSGITNRNSRLIFEIDSASVQNIVLRKRSEYRQGNRISNVNSRPAAIHTIRDYLNICLPHNIETEISSSVTENTRSRRDLEPLIDPRLSARPSSARATLNQSPPPRQSSTEIVKGAKGDEKALNFKSVQKIQRNLCVKADGHFGPSTRKKIQFYYRFIDGAEDLEKSVDVLQSAFIQKLLKLNAKCPDPIQSNGMPKGLGLMNIFEVTKFQKAEQISEYQKELKRALTGEKTLDPNFKTTGKLDRSMRNDIKSFRMKHNIVEDKDYPVPDDQIGPALDDKLRNEIFNLQKTQGEKQKSKEKTNTNNTAKETIKKINGKNE